MAIRNEHLDKESKPMNENIDGEFEIKISLLEMFSSTNNLK